MSLVKDLSVGNPKSSDRSVLRVPHPVDTSRFPPSRSCVDTGNTRDPCTCPSLPRTPGSLSERSVETEAQNSSSRTKQLCTGINRPVDEERGGPTVGKGAESSLCRPLCGTYVVQCREWECRPVRAPRDTTESRRRLPTESLEGGCRQVGCDRKGHGVKRLDTLPLLPTRGEGPNPVHYVPSVTEPGPYTTHELWSCGKGRVTVVGPREVSVGTRYLSTCVHYETPIFSHVPSQKRGDVR